MNRNRLLLIALVGCAAALATAFLPPPFRAIEEEITTLAYGLRGTLEPDTNIVIAYIDEPTARSLGWPVPRSYIALMLKTLSELKVRAVGCELVFEEGKLDYPEYDELLAAMAGGGRNVVVAAYFDRLGGEPPEVSGALPQFTYPGVADGWLTGDGIHLPFPALRLSAAGIGHVNLTGETDLPVFVHSPSGMVPGFGMELLRVGLGAERTGVVNVGNELRIAGTHGSLRFGVDREGAVALYFPGPVTAYRTYPFLEILRSYDGLRAGRESRIPLSSFRDKIVLVGVISEGRSQFYPTPVDPRTPSIALHAAFLDNALQHRFLLQVSPWILALIGGTLAAIAGGALLLLRGKLRWLVAGTALVVTIAGPLFLFAALGIKLAMIPLVVPLLAGSGAALSLRHRVTSAQVDQLEKEKREVLEQLHDREAKVAVLERELVSVQASRSADRTAELLDEIRKYKSEIRTLASRADDMEAYAATPTGEDGGTARYEGIVYSAAGPMSDVVEFLRKIASSEAPVLILGESGTGKELVARALHRRSPRASGPFVAVNCGALSESLLESELFGHEKGAFTGATKDRMGRFELAHGGTIFLDEIGEVSESFQVKLLRVLQEGEFERVGGSKGVRVNVRILAATNRDLKGDSTGKKFREDLYYRLNVLSLSLPPLRERREDIPLLVSSFLAAEGGGLTVSRNVMSAWTGFTWRGNVRELESAVKRAALLARAEKRTMITLNDLSEEISAAARDGLAVEEQVLDALREKGFSRSAISDTAGEMGGLNRGTVAEYLRGESLRLFVESSYDRDATVAKIALSADPVVISRVRKKLDEYLENIAGGVDPSRTWAEVRNELRPKMKNLPQRYHPFLESVAEAYFRGIWKL